MNFNWNKLDLNYPVNIFELGSGIGLRLIVFTFLNFVSSSLFSQNLIVTNKSNNKRIQFVIDDISKIQTKTDIYKSANFKTIISLINDSTFLAIRYSNMAVDTSSIANLSKKDSSNIFYSFRTDSVYISFSEIETIEKYRFHKSDWLILPIYVGLGAGVGLVALPFIAIFGKTSDLKDWVRTESYLVLLSAIPIFVGTRKRTFDMTKNWKLEVKN
jgi:hypothetical protein